MISSKLHMRSLSLFVAATVVAIFTAWQPSAAHDGGDATVTLLKALNKSKHSLADGVRQATKGGSAAVSAKFELDDGGKLSLSVYTVDKGIGVAPEDNVLKELAGSPEGDSWVPEAEVFKDVEHIARASQHLTLFSISPTSLLALIEKAQKQNTGTVFSATPMVKGHKPIVAILVASGTDVRTVEYDLLTGSKLDAHGG